MRNFTYVIGSSDDFADLEDLRNTHLNGDTERNMSTYEISLSEGTIVVGYDKLAEVATMIGRGEAMSDGWCLDDTLSFIMEE
jgi:hypothetical protein